MMNSAPRPKRPASKATIAGTEKRGVRAVARRQRDRQQDEPDERQREAPPLALADLEAEEAVGHDGEQHEAARQHDLDDRQRRQRDRADVQDPREEADEHADREPALAPQRAGRPQRVPDVDITRAASSAVLVQERQVRGEGAQQREENAELKAHEVVSSAQTSCGPVGGEWYLHNRQPLDRA